MRRTAFALLLLMSLAFAAPARADLPSLELRWHLDDFDAQALTTPDSSGHGRFGQESTAVQIVSGRFGNAFHFGGETVTSPSVAALQPAAVTLSAWVRAPSNPNAGGSAPARIAGLGGCGTAAYALKVAPDGAAIFTAAGTASPAAAPLMMWDGFWHSLTGVFASNRVMLYLDGHLVGSTASAGPINYAANPGAFSAGACPAGAEQYKGDLDELRVYSSALSAADIAWLSGTPQGAPPPVLPPPGSPAVTVGARLPLDQIGAGNTAPDVSGNGNGGNTVAATLTTGKYAGALDYASSGTSSGFLIDDNQYLHPQQFTISTWVKYTRTVNDHSRTIIGKGAGDVPPLQCSSHSWALRLGANDSSVMTSGLQFYVNLFKSDGGQIFLTPPVVPYTEVFDGNWHAVAASYANGTARVYVDGALKGSAAAPGAEEVDYSSRYPISRIGVGRYPDPSCALQGFRFPGAMDDLRIYDRELTGAQIAAIHGASSPAPDPPLPTSPDPTPAPSPTPTP